MVFTHKLYFNFIILFIELVIRCSFPLIKDYTLRVRSIKDLKNCRLDFWLTQLKHTLVNSRYKFNAISNFKKYQNETSVMSIID